MKIFIVKSTYLLVQSHPLFPRQRIISANGKSSPLRPDNVTSFLLFWLSLIFPEMAFHCRFFLSHPCFLSLRAKLISLRSTSAISHLICHVERLTFRLSSCPSDPKLTANLSSVCILMKLLIMLYQCPNDCYATGEELHNCLNNYPLCTSIGFELRRESTCEQMSF